MRALIPLFVTLLVLLLAWSSYRLNKAAQPLRMQFARSSQKLLANQNLPEHLKGFIWYLQTKAFGNRKVLLFGIFYVPVIAISMLFRPEWNSRVSKKFYINCPETRAQFHDVMRLHDRIAFLNNPILIWFLEIEITVFVATAIVLSAIFRDAPLERIGRDVAMDLIDDKSKRLHFPRMRLHEAA